MRVIIAGSRSVTQDQVNEAFTRCPWASSVTCVVSGGAKGADEYGEILAANLGIQVEIYQPEWSRYGKQAGPVRNREMAKNAEGLIAIWDGLSRGTENMINLAKKAGLRIYVFQTSNDQIISVDALGKVADAWALHEHVKS